MRRCAVGGGRKSGDGLWHDALGGEVPLLLGWGPINYRQDEAPAIETPILVGPIRVDLLLPDDAEVDYVEWRYPEMSKPLELDREVADGRVHFEIPRLIVYGISVIRLKS